VSIAESFCEAIVIQVEEGHSRVPLLWRLSLYSFYPRPERFGATAIGGGTGVPVRIPRD